MNRAILFVALGCLFAPNADLRAQSDVPADVPEPAVQPEEEPLSLRPGPTTSAPTKPPDDIWTRKQLTGDWGGARTELSKIGLTFDLRLSQYYQGVAYGGRNTNFAYGGTMDYRVNLDGKPLFGLEGFAVNMHARTRFGRDINSDAGAFALQNAGMLMPSPGDYHNTDITGLTVSQTFPLGDKFGNVLIGKLDVIDLVTMFFPSVGYGQEGFSNVNGLVTALPWFGAVRGLSLYGGWFVTINPEYKLAESGFLLTGTRNISTDWGSVEDSFEDGVWMAGFHRFFWKLDNKPGYFMVFGGGSTREQVSNEGNDFVNVPGRGIRSTDEEQPWDIALYLYQEFWHAEGNPDRKATVLLGGTVGPDNPQFAHWHVFAAVEGYGLMESRPHDRMGVSAYFNALSNKFTSLVSPVAELRDQWGVELYYNYEVTPWFHLTSDLQIVQNEWADDDPAIIVGIRGVIDF